VANPPAPPASARATEVLDALIRERERRPLFRRRAPFDEPWRSSSTSRPLTGPGEGVPVPDPADAGPTDGPPAARDPRDLRALLELDPRAVSPGRARVVVVLVVVVVVALGLFGRRYLERPAALDERLPIATATSRAPSDAGAAADAASSQGDTTASSSTSSSVDASSAPVFVHVAGAVVSPGVVQLGAAARVVDAVAAAGGLRADADPDRVNLAAPLVDGSRVVVPTVGQEPATELATVPPPNGAGETATPGTATGADAATPGAPLPLNSATAAQLDELPGVGPSTAQAILDHREREGPFTSVEGLLDVRGIGEAKLEALRDLVTVG
jgi:competence protein ComEA